MNLTCVESFVASAELGSFSAAAKRLQVSQPALSHRIGGLEKELGSTLFTRTNRRVFLTAEGEAFMPFAEEMLEASERARTRLRDLRQKSESTVRFRYCEDELIAVLPKLLSAITAQAPEINVELIRGTSDTTESDIAEGNADLAFMMGNWLDRAPVGDELRYIYLFDDPFCAVVNENHRLAQVKMVHLEDLHGQNVLLFNDPGYPEVHDELVRYHALHPKDLTIEKSERIDELLMHVLASSDVALVPFRTLPQGVAVACRPFEKGESFKVGLLRRKDPDWAVSVCVQIAKRTFAEYRD